MRVKDFQKSQVREIGVIYRADRYLSIAAQSFLAMLKKVLEPHRVDR